MLSKEIIRENSSKKIRNSSNLISKQNTGINTPNINVKIIRKSASVVKLRENSDEKTKIDKINFHINSMKIRQKLALAHKLKLGEGTLHIKENTLPINIKNKVLTDVMPIMMIEKRDDFVGTTFTNQIQKKSSSQNIKF